MYYPIGAMTGTSYAAGLVTLYPAWIREEYKACPNKINDTFQALLQRTPQNHAKAEEMMKGFLSEIGIFKSLVKLGIKEQQISAMVVKIVTTPVQTRWARKRGFAKGLYRESLVEL